MGLRIRSRASVSSSSGSVSEGGTATFLVRLDRALTSAETAATVSFELEGTSSDDDYTAPSPLTASFAADGEQDEVSVAIPITDDSSDEGDETLTLTLSSVSPSDASVALSSSVSSRSASVVILDDDAGLSLSVSSVGSTAVRVVVSESLGSGERFGYLCVPSCGGTRYAASSPFDVTGLSSGTSYLVTVWRAASDDTELNARSTSSVVEDG